MKFKGVFTERGTHCLEKGARQAVAAVLLLQQLGTNAKDGVVGGSAATQNAGPFGCYACRR
jgi:hypothetical protein